MVYKIYAKAKGKPSRHFGHRFGVWDSKLYKTRDSALKIKKILEKKHGKKGKYTPGFVFDVRKK